MAGPSFESGAGNVRPRAKLRLRWRRRRTPCLAIGTFLGAENITASVGPWVGHSFALKLGRANTACPQGRLIRRLPRAALLLFARAASASATPNRRTPSDSPRTPGVQQWHSMTGRFLPHSGRRRACFPLCAPSQSRRLCVSVTRNYAHDLDHRFLAPEVDDVPSKVG